MTALFKDILLAKLIGTENYIKQCLKNKVDLNQLDEHGFSQLHYAVYTNQLDLVTKLVENGADINIQSKNGYTALQTALAPHLIEVKSYQDDITFIHSEMIEKLLTLNANPNLHEHTFWNHTTQTESPLYLAVNKGHYDIACDLIKVGADLHISDWYNNNLLINAIPMCSNSPYYNEAAYHEFFNLLLEGNVDVNAKGGWGTSAIDLIISRVNLSFDPCYFDNNNEQGLSLFDKLLLSSPAYKLNDVADNDFYHGGGTKLHAAVDADNLFAVKALLAHGIDSSIVDSQGRTAKDLALENGAIHCYQHMEELENLTTLLHGVDNEEAYQNIYKLFLEKTEVITDQYQKEHADELFQNIESPYIFGEDPQNVKIWPGADYAMKVYIEYGKVDAVKAYIDAGFDVNQVIWNKLTPLENAIKFQYPDIAKLLVDNGAALELNHEAQLLKSNSMLIQAIGTLEEGAGKADLINCLIAKGADINAVDQFGMTPLLTATSLNDIQSSKQLLSQPTIDVHYQETTTHLSALDVAQNHHFDEIEKMLTSFDSNQESDHLPKIHMADVLDLDQSNISNEIINPVSNNGAKNEQAQNMLFMPSLLELPTVVEA